MFEALGYKVDKLTRIKYTIFDIKELKTGEYRKLTKKEINILYNLVNQANNK